MESKFPEELAYLRSMVRMSIELFKKIGYSLLYAFVNWLSRKRHTLEAIPHFHK